MGQEHDNLVLQIGQLLGRLGRVRVDLDRQDRAEHGFLGAKELPRKAPFLLSALVPTRALFTGNQRPPLSNCDWRTPDIVVESGTGREYVIDVYGTNDTNGSVARKVETIVYNAARSRSIVGAAIVGQGVYEYSQKQDELEAWRKTFWKLVGRRGRDGSEDSVCTYLAALMRLPAFAKVYGRPDWSRVLEINATKDSNWKSRILKHAKQALKSRKPLSFKD